MTQMGAEPPFQLTKPNVRNGSEADIRGLTHLPCATLDCMINGARHCGLASALALARQVKGLQ